MWGIIATWCMAHDGVKEASEILKNDGKAGEAIETAIKNVEDFPFYKSVGYGGLPNEEMEVELDAAYMDGSSFDFGAVCAIKDFANPISVARDLSHLNENSMLVSEGAEKYAHKKGFERKNMLTERAKIHYRNRLKDMAHIKEIEIKPYSGHDTVGMVCLDKKENIGTAKATINGSHANGLNYVPFDGYIAELHKGERVLTKDENESIFGSLRNRLQNTTQSSKSENSTSSEKSITYQIYNSFTFNGVSEDTKNSIIENLQEKLNELQRQLEKMKEERETYARTSL